MTIEFSISSYIIILFLFSVRCVIFTCILIMNIINFLFRYASGIISGVGSELSIWIYLHRMRHHHAII